jgi:exopolysaccharide biosynthesis polyprenyl glycosylphosphotransferase
MNGQSVIFGIEPRRQNARVAAASPKRRRCASVEFLVMLALIGDSVVTVGALCLGFWVRFDSGWIPLFRKTETVPFLWDYVGLIALGTLFLIVSFTHLGLYRRGCFLRYRRIAKVIVEGSVFWFFAYLALSLILKFDPPISRLFMASSFVCGLAAMLLWRWLFWRITRWEIFSVSLRQRVLFVGWGEEARKLEKEIRGDRRHPYEIVGCLRSPGGHRHWSPSAGVPVLGDYASLAPSLREHRPNIIILADLHVKMEEIVKLANLCEKEFAQFKIIPSYFQTFASGLQLETISGIPVLGVGELPLERFSNRLLKRLIDIAGALVGLLISTPLMAIFGFLVYRESPGPILYPQERMGRNGRTFRMFKIRSMKVNAEEDGPQWARENDPRRLRIGAFMRRWNIDEVPQFWNVFKGEMSLVGPRPERPELIRGFESVIPHYHARHSCLPGMTGWAQVNGWRGNTSLEERIRADIWYVEHWNLWLDFRIMLQTFFSRDNAY